MRLKNLTAAITLALALVATSCGQAQDEFPAANEFTQDSTDAEVEPTTAESTSTTTVVAPTTSTTAVPTTDIGIVDVDTTDPVSTPIAEPVSPEPAIATDVAGASDVASTPEFCDASAGYYVATEAGDFVSRRNQAAVRALFEEMEQRLLHAVDTAPNEQLAEVPQSAVEHLAAVHDGIAYFNYDGDAFEGSSVMDALGADFDALARVQGLLEGYLEGECGVSLQQLRVDGSLLAEALVAGVNDGEFVSYTEVVDSADRIKVELPSHWDDIVNQQGGETAILVASPDASLFDSSWAIDGIRITTRPAPAVVDLDSVLERTPAAVECRLVGTEPYDDGTYEGLLATYRNCGIDSVATVIAAVSHDGQDGVLVELQFDSVESGPDATTLRNVIDTFLVR